MTTQPIQKSSSVKEACDHFLSDLGDWVRVCIQAYEDEPPTDGHDQGTYTTSWGPYIHLVDNTQALHFLTDLRDKIAKHFIQSNKWHHGYWVVGEAHHGTEHFELFLNALYDLNKSDATTVEQFLDAAEHMGNWHSDTPAWFDWDTGLYRSMWLGTGEVGEDPGSTVNIPDHFRCMNISLIAYRMTGLQRYLDLAQCALTPWANAILAQSRLPVGLLPEGAIYDLNDETNQTYRRFAGQASALVSDVDRAENFLASNGVGTFLSVWQLTHNDLFLKAGRRLLDVIATQLDDPDAGPAAAILRTYRRMTGDTRYDQAVLSAIEQMPSTSVNNLTIDSMSKRDVRPSGIGKRTDMPFWYEDGRPRHRNPMLLALAAEITDDERMATEAVDLAWTYFNLARQVYPDGRHHGCSARSISAVARGHGRDNNAGMVTAVLEPLCDTFVKT